MAPLHTLLAHPPDGPKPVVVRHRIMREYMPKRGTLGHDMMFRSCTIQVRQLLSTGLVFARARSMPHWLLLLRCVESRVHSASGPA